MYPLTFYGVGNTKDPAMYQYMCSVKEITPLPQTSSTNCGKPSLPILFVAVCPEPASLMVDFNDMQKWIHRFGIY